VSLQKIYSNTTAISGGQNVPSPKHQNTEKCKLTNVFLKRLRCSRKCL
jgi:hypothetical protein